MSKSGDNELERRYKRVRAAFLLQDTSLSGWCKANGVAMPNARAAMMERWNGPAARLLVQRIIEDAGIEKAA